MGVGRPGNNDRGGDLYLWVIDIFFFFFFSFVLPFHIFYTMINPRKTKIVLHEQR